MSATPFTDPALISGPLYARASRLAQRTGALHRAKTIGADATATIAALAAAAAPAATRAADVGCGRGTTTLRLARHLPTARLVAVDQSPALLAVVGDRLRHHRLRADLVCADFHHLPLPAATVDLVVAAFCLYHSPHPQRAVAELARCLTSAGRAILVTKSADSYHEIDHLLATTGLDPGAAHRPSLYRTFHTANAEDIAVAAGLIVERRLDQKHVFEFADVNHLADYVVTSPKYHLAPGLAADSRQLAAQLRHRAPERPVTTTSTVTYLVAARR